MRARGKAFCAGAGTWNCVDTVPATVRLAPACVLVELALVAQSTPVNQIGRLGEEDQLTLAHREVNRRILTKTFSDSPFLLYWLLPGETEPGLAGEQTGKE